MEEVYQEREHDCFVESGVTFDLEAAASLSAGEIRKRWPRKRCPVCNAICYASLEHYTEGDW